MKIGFLKKLDKYAGLPLCALLTAVNLCLPSPGAFEKTKVRKTLFMKFWGLGSILLLAPAVREFRRTYPQSRVVFLTLSRNREISEALGLFDEVLTVDVDRGWGYFFATMATALRAIWRHAFDLVVDFEFFTRFSTILTFFTFARHKVGYHSWETWRGNIHTIKVPFNRYWHIMDNFYNLCSNIGVQRLSELQLVRPVVRSEDREAVDELLRGHKVVNRIMTVHVNASDLIIERRWPYENFIELINRVVSRHDIAVIFIGSQSEAGMVEEIMGRIKRPSVLNFAAKLSIRQLAYLFERSELIVSNDSGPLHLAVAMGVPTVSFFGPETPVIYGPRGKEHKVFFKNLDCSPCVNVHDRKSVHCYWAKPRCMEAITVDEVYDAIHEKLDDEKSTVA
jgi:ADP-heptose:LPS heptosyltransferase